MYEFEGIKDGVTVMVHELQPAGPPGIPF